MPKKELKHIAVAGNIGAGKTSLSGMLAKHYNWEVHYEDADNNPYLEDFYHDMQRWSFNLQIYFLNSRFQQVLQIRNGDKVIIQDRTIYEDAKIFAPNLYEMSLMEKRDFTNYQRLFENMTQHIDAPDLLIYLRANVSTLVDHINKRGRDYDGNMSLEYLKKLNERYENWIEGYSHGKLLIINVDDIDFIKNHEDFASIIDLIDAQLFGLFE